MIKFHHAGRFTTPGCGLRDLLRVTFTRVLSRFEHLTACSQIMSISVLIPVNTYWRTRNWKECTKRLSQMSMEDGKTQHGRGQKERHKITEEIRSFQDVKLWPRHVLN